MARQVPKLVDFWTTKIGLTSCLLMLTVNQSAVPLAPTVLGAVTRWGHQRASDRGTGWPSTPTWLWDPEFAACIREAAASQHIDRTQSQGGQTTANQRFQTSDPTSTLGLLRTTHVSEHRYAWVVVAFMPTKASLIFAGPGDPVSFQLSDLKNLSLYTTNGVLSLQAVVAANRPGVKGWPTGYPLQRSSFSVWCAADLQRWAEAYKGLMWSDLSRPPKSLTPHDFSRWHSFPGSLNGDEHLAAVNLAFPPPGTGCAPDMEMPVSAPATVAPHGQIKEARISYGGGWTGRDKGSSKCPFTCTARLGPMRKWFISHLENSHLGEERERAIAQRILQWQSKDSGSLVRSFTKGMSLSLSRVPGDDTAQADAVRHSKATTPDPVEPSGEAQNELVGTFDRSECESLGPYLTTPPLRVHPGHDGYGLLGGGLLAAR